MTEMFLYYVWPDGSVWCPSEDGSPPDWKSDDFMRVWAYDEDDALRQANLLK